MDGAFPARPGAAFDSGGGGPGPARGGFRGTAENAKTRLCSRWMQGDCRFGDRCNFAHGEQELRGGGGGGAFDMGGGRGGYGGRGGGVAPRGGYGGPGGSLGAGGRGGGMMGGMQQGGRGGGRGYGYGGGAAPYDATFSTDVLQQEQYAASGFPTHGPNGWIMYRAKETGEAYYHNHRTGTTQWERPTDWPNMP